MREVRSFVVRVYREDRSGLRGTVQDVATGRVVPFQDTGELWRAISSTSTHSSSAHVRRRKSSAGQSEDSTSEDGDDHAD